jgi:predicted N-formylglutamate amidohydrolase
MPPGGPKTSGGMIAERGIHSKQNPVSWQNQTKWFKGSKRTMSHPASAPAPLPPFVKLPGDYNRGVVVICDHASKTMPPELKGLGLSPEDLERHIAWDIGAAEVAIFLAARFKLPAVFCGVSRLVIDCNRDPADPASIPTKVDGTPIPGNANMKIWDKAERMSRWFQPYHNAIEETISVALSERRDPVVLSIHSMTPALKGGEKRPWPIALSSHEDRRLTTPMLAALQKRIKEPIGDNEPYALDPKEDYSIPHHAMKRGLRHLQVEFRQDIVGNSQGAAQLAKVFGDALGEVLGI